VLENSPPNGYADDPAKRRFLWGVLLAWTPFLFAVVPSIIGIFNAFREISTQKATSLGAVAGDLAEAFATFGLAAAFAFEVAAVGLLVRILQRAPDPYVLLGTVHLLQRTHAQHLGIMRVVLFPVVSFLSRKRPNSIQAGLFLQL
jgi:hypothetical protein